jgi:hypothetical protein
MALERLVIEVDSRDLGPGVPKEVFTQFNPTEYSRAKGAQIAEIPIPGIDSPILQFVRGQTETLSMELFFDTTEFGTGEGPGVVDVRTLTGPVYQLVKMQSKTHAPPRVIVHLGPQNSFRAIIENVQQKFTLFNPKRIPLRAMVTVAFKEYKTLEEQLLELNLQSADHSKLRTIRGGDTISQIAFEEYGDASLWRLIAQDPANARILTNLRKLPPGELLLIPPGELFGKPTGGSA